MTPRCYHRHGSHPELRSPIDQSQLFREAFRILDLGGIGFWEGISYPWFEIQNYGDRLDSAHKRNARRYADYSPKTQVIAFAPQTLYLPAPQRRGLIAHEIGHALAGSLLVSRGKIIAGKPNHSEKDADLAALRFLGIRITYDRRWPGKGLQTARMRAGR